MARPEALLASAFILYLLYPLIASKSDYGFTGNDDFRRRSSGQNLSMCEQLIRPSGYQCTEHTNPANNNMLVQSLGCSTQTSRQVSRLL